LITLIVLFEKKKRRAIDTSTGCGSGGSGSGSGSGGGGDESKQIKAANKQNKQVIWSGEMQVRG